MRCESRISCCVLRTTFAEMRNVRCVAWYNGLPIQKSRAAVHPHGGNMAVTPRTLSLEVSSEGFAHVTFAMMTQSNKMLKLQGFGQCLSCWLEDWSSGSNNLQFADQATLSFDAMSHPEAKIWVALSPASMKKLREFRDFLGNAR